MGGKRRKNKVPRDDRDSSKKPKNDSNNENKNNKQGVWKTPVLHSDKFIAYYKGLGIVPENEWDQFIQTLKTPLPITFRITGTRIFASEIKHSLESQFLHMPDLKLDDELVQPPKPIPWYPNNGAWSFNASRKQVRKTPELESFHQFMVAQNEFGNITRQEAVSMIPPLLLNVEPHHRVIDMCAAPGSKTGQIIEFLHTTSKDKPPTGMVVANDADQTRCYTLTHQIKRLGSECVLVTNHEAQAFPYVKVELGKDEVALEGTNRFGKIDYQFDRVLCDVPCSGDGTLRKNPDLWGRWTTNSAIGLHTLQIKITLRGAHTLKVGGRMVYSTCSLNPVEDEAVVAQILRHTKGALRLVDVSKELPLLKRANGINTWRVQDIDGSWYSKHDDIPLGNRKKKIQPSTFPPTEDEAKEFQLHKCMRILPHVQDTGGFFIAVFEKVSSLFALAQPTNSNTTVEKPESTEIEVKESKEEVEEVQPEVEDLKSLDATSKPVRGKGHLSHHNFNEDPFLPFPPEMMPAFESIKSHFGLRDDFPVSQFVVRSERSPKIYFVSPGVSEILRNDEKKVLRAINTGIKTFMKHDAKDQTYECQYRVCQEGANAILPYITKRKIVISEADFLNLLNNKDPFVSTFSPAAREVLTNTSAGSLIFIVDPNCGKQWAGMSATGWKGKVSCHLLLPKEELNALKNLWKIANPKSTENTKEEMQEATV